MEIAKEIVYDEGRRMNPLNSREVRFLLCLGGLLAGVFVSGLAGAEDAAVAENPADSFRPDREIPVAITLESADSAANNGIRWNPDSAKVVIRSFGSSSRSTLHLEGVLDRPRAGSFHLVWSDRSFDVDSDGKFSIDIPYEAGLDRIQLATVSRGGTVRYQVYRVNLVSSAGREIPASEFNSPLKRRFFLLPGIGIGRLSYSQSGISDFNAWTTMVKVSGNYLLFPPKWDLGFTAVANVLNFSRTSSSDVRFLALNLRLGYLFPGIRDPWRFGLYGGWYYSTMYASDGTFGYKNVTGPQLFPALRRTFENGHALSGYVKYSPVSRGFRLMKLDSNELAFGLAYLIPGGSRVFGIHLDYARLRFVDSPSADDIVTVNASSITLGGSLTF
jgi:hypothetical protein